MAANENVFHEAFLQVGINTRRPIRIGVEKSTIVHHGRPYLIRFILYFAATLRLHKFLRGDDDRAPHDHPWWFITFPFTSYVEKYWIHRDDWDGETAYLASWRDDWVVRTRVVKAWRFHFRPAKFRHFVIGRADGKTTPFWTFCITGMSGNPWGFWPTTDTFVPWRVWK